jgi:hypothetical protein
VSQRIFRVALYIYTILIMLECPEKLHFIGPQICVTVACLEGFLECFIDMGAMATLPVSSLNLKVPEGYGHEQIVQSEPSNFICVTGCE